MAIAAAARVRENNLLNLIAEKCVKGLEYTTETLDYTRELITFLEYVVAELPSASPLARIAVADDHPARVVPPGHRSGSRP